MQYQQYADANESQVNDLYSSLNSQLKLQQEFQRQKKVANKLTRDYNQLNDKRNSQIPKEVHQYLQMYKAQN